MTKIIEVKNLAKQYKITSSDQPVLSLREKISHPWQAWQHRLNRRFFWALHDINFSINQGEIVGLVGKNGSGKSTLLKILSQITPPTKGLVKLQGKVASLLEVGIGFHAELTGRENIYFSGVILGMSKEQVDQKFQQIVDFAGVAKFLDTPVKRYSSGMLVRLGFAVAAHLNAEIMIIDEVLAVSDDEFRQKSEQKIKELISKEDKTILLVSHNIETIKNFCDKILLLDNGHLVYFGSVEIALQKYNNLIDN